tara:strand:- start:769 stop:924 length:156 start_codon:yes stop_codon:yes gene_type:complete
MIHGIAVLIVLILILQLVILGGMLDIRESLDPVLEELAAVKQRVDDQGDTI